MKTPIILQRVFRLFSLALLAGLISSAPAFAQSTPLLDQSQVAYNVWANLYNQDDAQSFVPAYDRLVRVDVQLMVSAAALDFVELTVFPDNGSGFPDVARPLASANPRPGPDALVDGNLTTGWYVADLGHLAVQPGQTYYIRLNLSAASPDTEASWAVADGYLNPAFANVYTNGSWWFGVGSFPQPVPFPLRDATFKTYYLPQLSPLERLADLLATVQSVGLRHGIENSLAVKLVAAMDALAQQDSATCANLLQAFTNEVQALSGKQLTPAQASDLLAQAAEIAASLEEQTR